MSLPTPTTAPAQKLTRPPAIMLDLETLGNTPGSVIVTIGAVKFDAVKITDRFECHIDPESCVKNGLHIDASAVVWWLKQDDIARGAITRDGRLDLPDALGQFAAWIGNPKTEVWANGSDFDNVLLAAAYKAATIDLPWHYTYNRCYRTLSRLCPSIPFVRNKNAHTALDDAKAQARHLIKIRAHLGI